MGGCHWKITRCDGGYDVFHKARYIYVLGDTDSYPGPKGKSFPTESMYTSEAEALSALADSMGAPWSIGMMLKLWAEDVDFRKKVEHDIHRFLWLHGMRGCIHDPYWRPIMEKEDEADNSGELSE
jgi:hypothetical protein